MRRLCVVARVVVGALMATAASVEGVAAQVTRRDSTRTVIVDSVQKTYGVPVASQDARASRVAPDLARTIDAEIRVATFELISGAELPALSRLERLATLAGQDSSVAAAAERSSLHFLLAESYYRLGMLEAFRREAEASLAGGQSRYASLLRPQLVVEAYRTGDYARATALARDLPPDATSGLATLVAGLAAYQSGDLAAARAAFQRATTAGGDIAGYARYMDVLAQLRADTAQTAGAVTALESVAGSTSGDLADQARLTAAQVAYEAERYADALRLTTAIGEQSRVAAPALLTRAWALYKLDQVSDAERAFTEFATRYPRLPERDEAQLMAAQAQLELGRAADAERNFQSVADSSAAEVAAMQAQTNAALADLSRALVTDRAADLVVAGDPLSAKALVLRDSSSTAVAFTALTGSAPEPSAAGMSAGLSIANVADRLDSLGARTAPGVTRLLFAPASATRQPRDLVGRSQALTAADASVAVARYRLGEQLAAQEREIALLASLASLLAIDSAAVSALAAQYQTVADSMARLDQLMAAAETRLREMLGREIEATRASALENARTADSLRAALSSSATPADREALDAEFATATAYSRMAEAAAGGLDNAIARHPAFAMRDSVRAHSAHARAVLAELQGSYSGSRRALANALDALRAGDGPAARAARQALADAEARRTSLEGEVLAAITTELSARVGEMIAGLQRGAEAAQFGTASAAFFRAIDGARAVGEAGGGGAGARGVSGAAGSTGTSRVAAPERRR